MSQTSEKNEEISSEKESEEKRKICDLIKSLEKEKCFKRKIQTKIKKTKKLEGLQILANKNGKIYPNMVIKLVDNKNNSIQLRDDMLFDKYPQETFNHLKKELILFEKIKLRLKRDFSLINSLK